MRDALTEPTVAAGTDGRFHCPASPELARLLGPLANGDLEWDNYLVAADAALDAGAERLSSALRWQAENRKRPYGSKNGGVWFDAGGVSPDLDDHESNLPPEVYAALPGGNRVANHKTYPTMAAALLALWTALRAGRGWTTPARTA